jgi:hypothetical protein
MTEDLKLKSVEELLKRINGELEAFVQASFACDMDGAALSRTSAHDALAELSSRASQLSALRDALEWLDGPAMLDSETMISYWLDGDDTVNGTEVQRNTNESLPDFILRTHASFLASQTNTPSQ